MERVGKYELVQKIATGGMAEVFLAKTAGPMGFEKSLVVKRILPHLVEEPSELHPGYMLVNPLGALRVEVAR